MRVQMVHYKSALSAGIIKINMMKLGCVSFRVKWIPRFPIGIPLHKIGREERMI